MHAADIPDQRLALMFACAHPAIDQGVRAPLILQTVLGFDAATIASAFLVAPATMGQRLSRAKAKIRQAGIPFRVPERADLAERLDAVLAAIYAAFAEGWSDPAGTQTRRRNLSEEGIWLGRLVASLLPDEAEAFGPARADAARRSAPRRAPPRRRVRAARRAGPRRVGCRADRRSRSAAAPRQHVRHRRPLSARSRGAIRACGAPHHRPHRLGRAGKTLRRAARAHRFAGRRDQSRGRASPKRKAPPRASRRSMRCRTMRGLPTINPIGRRAPGCWRGWRTRKRPAAPMSARSGSKAIRPSAASCKAGVTLSEHDHADVPARHASGEARNCKSRDHHERKPPRVLCMGLFFCTLHGVVLRFFFLAPRPPCLRSSAAGLAALVALSDDGRLPRIKDCNA